MQGDSSRSVSNFHSVFELCPFLSRIYLWVTSTLSHSLDCAPIMTTYQSLLQDTASFNRGVNLTQKIFKSKKRSMLDILPIIYRKPRQLDPPHQILVEPAVPRKSKASCSIEPSTSRSSVTINRGPRREILPRSKRPMRTRRGPSLCDQTLAEIKKNYKTLMSLIGRAATKEDQSDINQPSDHSEVTSR